MLRLISSRILSSIAAIVGASIVSFIFLRLIPGNPARLILGQFASQAAVDQLVRDMGLKQPLYVQYYKYMWAFLRGDWGYSYSTGESVTAELGHRLPATIELGLYAFAFAFVGALALALIATYRRRPAVDGGVRGLSYFGLGTPPFWLGLVLLIAFSAHLHVLPGPEGRLSANATPPPSITGLYTVDALITGHFATLADALWHLVLPAITLGLAPLAFLVRLLRANLLEVSHEPFIVVVRSKGVGRFTAFVRHALPNAFLPTLTASGLLLGQLVAGSVLVEKVFNWPGAGELVASSILTQDYAVVQAFIILSAFVYVIVNFGVDILYGVIDPRVRVVTTARSR